MPKFIVRDASCEYYTTIVAANIDLAELEKCERLSVLHSLGSYSDYIIEPAPEAEMFKDDAHTNDFKYVGSKHHY